MTTRKGVSVGAGILREKLAVFVSTETMQLAEAVQRTQPDWPWSRCLDVAKRSMVVRAINASKAG